MDEADLLGDRIAIMAQGQLRCAGSSLFLKRKYGVGYQLTIIKNPIQTHALQGQKEKDLNDILEGIVKGAVPSATLLSNVGTELSFQLPLRESAKFIEMFVKLDEQTRENRIESYGVSVTTLDEVFLTVARGEEGLHLSSVKKETTLANNETDKSNRYTLGVNDQGAQFTRHVQALFRKRAKNFKRDKKAWCCSTILPTLITLSGFLIVNYVSQQNPNYSSLTLSLDQNNPEITVDRNPIPFNNPGTYPCQPGRCVYDRPKTTVAETSEEYYFCGANAKVYSYTNSTDTNSTSNNITTTNITTTDNTGTKSLASCTITDSTRIIDQISQHGAFGVGKNVSDVLNSTYTVFETAYDFDASLYGGFYFTHDEASVTSSGSIFDENAIETCAGNPGSYMTTEQCVQFGGIGFIVK